MKKSIFLFLSLLLSQFTFAQQGDSLGLMAHVGTNSVMLKWLPSSYNLWMEGSRLGYTIQRTEVQVTNGKWKVVSAVTLTTEPIKPWSDERITKEAETNPDLTNAKVLIAGRIFQDNPQSGVNAAEIQSQKDYLHVMSLLANLLKNKSSECRLCVDAENSLGLAKIRYALAKRRRERTIVFEEFESSAWMKRRDDPFTRERSAVFADDFFERAIVK